MAKKIDIKGALTKAAAAGAGAIAAGYINKLIPMKSVTTGTGTAAVTSQQPVLNAKLTAGLKIVIGAMLPAFIGKGKAGGMIADFSTGIMAAGAADLAKEVGISGIAGTIYPTLGYAYPSYIPAAEADIEMAGIGGEDVAYDQERY